MSKLKKPILTAALIASLCSLHASDNPRALMLQARERQRQGEIEDTRNAAALYRRVLLQVPDSAEAHLRLSECLADLSDLPGATAEAIRATELAPRNGEAWAHLGILCQIQSQNRPDLQAQARQALSKATRLMPQDVELWWRLGEVCESLKDEPEALRAWIHLARLRPAVPMQGRSLESYAWERVVVLGKQLKQYEARREAVMALGAPPKAEPRHLKMLEELAREQAEQGFLGHAEESFLLLGEHLPKEAGIWENIALVRLQTNNFQGALESLERAQALESRSRNSYYMALCQMNLGKLADAEAHIETLLQGSHQDAELAALLPKAKELQVSCALLMDRPQRVLGLTQAWAGDLQKNARCQSLALMAKVRLQDFKSAWLQLLEGMETFKEQEIFALAQAFEADLDWKRKSPRKKEKQILLQLEREMTAHQWAYIRQWRQCLDVLREVCAIAPIRSLETQLLHASVLDHMGAWQEAIEVLRAAQRLHPKHSTLQNNLGYLMLEHGGDLQEAATLIQSALEQEPSNASVLDSWGWALFLQGKLPEAESALRKAAELNPFSPETRRHLGEALLRQGKEQEALEQWERALAHAFPGRKALEEQVQSLKARLSKQRAVPDQEDDLDESLEFDDDEELP